MIFEKSCGAVVYSASDNNLKYLIVQMQLGHYGFPKGHMENGESEEQTALREIREETNLSVQIETNFQESVRYSPYSGCIKEVVYFIASASDTRTKCQQEEIRDIQWLSYDQALDILTHDNDREILRKANAIISEQLNHTKIIFVRHGKDDDSYRGGWSDLDLIPEGIDQAKRLAEYLHNHNNHYNITKIISSDLPRAMTTAGYISAELRLPVIPEKRLREMDNGDLAGMRNSDALVKYPGVFFSTLMMDEPFPSGESPKVFYTRIKMWFEDFLAQTNENTVIVTHGGVINIIYHLVKKVDWNNQNRPFKATNCSVHILDTELMEFLVENNTDFLS